MNLSSLFSRLPIPAFGVLLVATISAQRLPPPAVSTDERIASIERRLKQALGNPGLRDELAGAYIQKMRESADGAYLERASKLVAAALEVDPSNYEARRRHIEIEMHRHHFRQVVALAGALRSERSNDAAVLGLLGDAHMELGNYDDAAGAYQEMADLRPSLASYNRIAFYRFVTGDPEGAAQIMRQAIRMGSSERENVAWCLVDLGNMLFKTSATGEAEDAYRQALALFPGYHQALAGLGRIMAARGDSAAAIRLLLEAQSRAPFPEYAGLLARLFRKAGNEEQARRQIAMLDVADRLDRAAGEAANRNLAIALADLRHRTPRALELARAEVEIRRDVYTYDALAWALFRNGQTQEAASAMDKALAWNTPEPLFHEHAARIFEAAGRPQLAAQHRERVRASNLKFDDI